MATPASLLAFPAVLAILVSVSFSANDDSSYCTCNEQFINRRGFPHGFIFGVGSSAFQIEGAYNQSGKGISMWDHYSHTYPERIADHSNADVATDSYHLYKEDVKLLKDMRVDSYKFSISWTRILPGGNLSQGVNQDGINYYNNLINELLANGIEPWVTLLHLDSPQALQDAYGGFLGSQIVQDFQDFADVLFSQFGDRVKHWMTINEPWGLSYLGYSIGIFAPGRCSIGCLGGSGATEPYIVIHNQLLAHAAVVKLYRDKYQEVQKGKIGIIVNTFWFVPYDQTLELDLIARDRSMDFMLGWAMDPVTFGRYPESMRDLVGDRLPEFTKDEAEMIKGSFDFLGLNYYSAMYAKHQSSDRASYLFDSGAMFQGTKDGVPIGEQGRNGSWYNMYPKGLRNSLQYIKQKYNDPLIYITENGLDMDASDNMTEAIQDYKRKKNFVDHLCCLREAIEEDGANVKGYFAWSLTDNYEWASGYTVSFGLHYVDFNNKSLPRYPKQSALWYKSILSKEDPRLYADQ